MSNVQQWSIVSWFEWRCKFGFEFFVLLCDRHECVISTYHDSFFFFVNVKYFAWFQLGKSEAASHFFAQSPLVGFWKQVHYVNTVRLFLSFLRPPPLEGAPLPVTFLTRGQNDHLPDLSWRLLISTVLLGDRIPKPSLHLQLLLRVTSPKTASVITK